MFLLVINMDLVEVGELWCVFLVINMDWIWLK